MTCARVNWKLHSNLTARAACLRGAPSGAQGVLQGNGFTDRENLMFLMGRGARCVIAVISYNVLIRKVRTKNRRRVAIKITLYGVKLDGLRGAWLSDITNRRMLTVWYTHMRMSMRRSLALMVPPGFGYTCPWVVRHALEKPGVDWRKKGSELTSSVSRWRYRLAKFIPPGFNVLRSSTCSLPCDARLVI